MAIAASVEADDFTVDRVLRELMHPGVATDAEAIARAALRKIPPGQLEGVLFELLKARVQYMNSQVRSIGLQVVQGSDVLHERTVNVAAAGSKRWAQARKSVAEQAEALRQMPVFGQRGVPFAECTLADVKELVTLHTRLANTNAKRAADYQRVLDAMKEARVRKVSRLSDGILVAAFSVDA